MERYWNKALDSVHDVLDNYPLLSYAAAVCQKSYRLLSEMANQMSLKSDFVALFRRFIHQSQAISTTIVRIIDVIYHGEELMSYSFDYDVSAGKIQYSQILPFQWFKFTEYPDIVQVIEAFAISDPQSQLADQIDYRALQHELVKLAINMNCLKNRPLGGVSKLICLFSLSAVA